jgi:hypothetical protein
MQTTESGQSEPREAGAQSGIAAHASLTVAAAGKCLSFK